MTYKKHSPLQEIPLPGGRIRLWVKRDDLLHPHISGNKMRKLKYNLAEMRRRGKNTLLTYGGAFSNHIAATAAAGHEGDFRTVGIIRGERPPGGNATLNFAESCGMHLHFVSRAAYRQKDSPEFGEELRARFGDFYLLPEGGSNLFALPGCAEIITETETEIRPDYYCVPVGTGGTAAGMLTGMTGGKLLAFSALKGDFLAGEIDRLLRRSGNDIRAEYRVLTEYHHGGYAKFTSELIDFINDFKYSYGIPLDPLYTGKMFYGIFDLLRRDFFAAGSTVVAVHTGGLQGIKGFNARFGELLDV